MYRLQIASNLSFAELAQAAAVLGELKSIEAISSGVPLPLVDAQDPAFRAQRRARFQAVANARVAKAKALRVETLARVLRDNPGATLDDLVELMNQTEVRPNYSRSPWNEASLETYIPAARELQTTGQLVTTIK